MDQLVVRSGVAGSASEAKRLIQQGGIRIDDQRVEDPYGTRRLRPGDELLVQKGRREFRRLRVVAGEG
jgi:tyrosyl-tRNA synthetase